MSRIVVCKLVSSECVFGELVSEEEKIVLKNPHVLMSTQQGVALVSFTPELSAMTGKEMEVLELNKSHVLVMLNASEQLANAHAEKCGGLLTGQNKSLVLPPS